MKSFITEQRRRILADGIGEVTAQLGVFILAAGLTAGYREVTNVHQLAPVAIGVITVSTWTMLMNKLQTGSMYGTATARPVRFLWRGVLLLLGSFAIFAAIQIAATRYLPLWFDKVDMNDAGRAVITGLALVGPLAAFGSDVVELVRRWRRRSVPATADEQDNVEQDAAPAA